MDASGIREDLRDMVRPLASVGYYVVLPDLYYRSRMLEVRAGAMIPDEKGVPPAAAQVYALNMPDVMSDTDALLDYVAMDPAASAGGDGRNRLLDERPIR